MLNVHPLVIFKAVALFAAGWSLALLLRKGIDRYFKTRLSTQQIALTRKIIMGIVIVTFSIAALDQLELHLGLLLSAGGIFTVALGIASQTSASNLISGLFLMFEKPFVIGDHIKINDILGKISSIDLLSIKLRTDDNVMVRIPNEAMIKTPVFNYTRFPIRRLDIPLTVTYQQNLPEFSKILLNILSNNDLTLKEKEPEIMWFNFDEKGIHLRCSVWTNTGDYATVRNHLIEKIQMACAAQKIEISLPQTVVHIAKETSPLDIKIKKDRPE